MALDVYDLFGDPTPAPPPLVVEVPPVEQVNDRIWVKRDDLHRPFASSPINGAKTYQCLSLLQGCLDDIRSKFDGTVFSENYLNSPQGPIVARIAQELGLRCIIPIGCGSLESAMAKHKAARLIVEYGGELDVLCKMPAGPVLKSKALNKYGGRFFHVAFGMNALDTRLSNLVVGPVAAQVEAFRGLPTETMTLVVPSGSCIVFAGLLIGLGRTGIRFKRIVSVQVAGYDRTKNIRAVVGDAPVPAYDHIVDDTYPYNRHLHRSIGNIDLDSQYEAKAWDWVQREIPHEPVLFYNIGNSNWAR
jgi:1-aminocyclopropane-1-carboxylate deaminase/D-cysteine desulfhydrase-like pyridoxal-dependent ACC family enzyme